MEKIEKLELPINDPKRGVLNSGAGNIEITRKVNEIIDRLNEQPEGKMWETSEIELEEGMVIDTPDGKRKIGKTYTSKNTPEEYRSPEVLGAIARGYSTERNRSKVLDPDLCEDIGIEVQQLLEEREDKAREEEIRHLVNTDKKGLNWRVEALRRLSKLNNK